MKILNLYAGIGGNRKLWGTNHEITAVENQAKIANVYSSFFPKDIVLIEDAHKFLLNHLDEFDFIWSSPPCPSHSITNNFLFQEGIRRYPDMRLYQEIILLSRFFKGKWVVENVKSYYKPLIKPQEIGRHFFWSNFKILPFKEKERDFNIINGRECSRQLPDLNIKSLEKFHGFDLSEFQGDKRLWLRNCVNPLTGKHVFECAFRYNQTQLS